MLSAFTYKFLFNKVPRYLGPLVRVADVPGRRALRSANTDRLLVRSSYHLSAAGPFRSLHLIYNLKRFSKHYHICSVIILFPAASHDLSLSAILSGHHCDTGVERNLQ